MATPLQEAKARVERVTAYWKARWDADQKNAKLRQPLEQRRGRLIDRGHKVRILIQRPGSWVNGSLSAWAVGYFIDRSTHGDVLGYTALSKRIARSAELVLSGAQKINLASEGTSLTCKGAASRSRILDAAAWRRIDAARKKRDAAQAALRKAEAELAVAFAREHAAGRKLEPEVLAQYVGENLALRLSIDALPTNTFSEQRASDDRKDAARHLEHVQSKSKEPCPCYACNDGRRKAEWATFDQKRKAEAEAKARERVKTIAHADKVSFTCPACEMDSVSPIWPGTGEVECQDEHCGWSGKAVALRTKRLPKSAKPGLVGVPESEVA